MHQYDSQIVVNSVKGKIAVSRDIINLVKDIRGLGLYFKDFVLNYYYRSANKDDDVIAKKAHMEAGYFPLVVNAFLLI